MRRKKPDARWATADDVAAFFAGKPAPTMRARVAVLDGDVVGLAGLMTQNGHLVVFSEIRPALRRFPMFILREARVLMQAIGEREAWCIADRSERGAERFLTYLGWRFVATTSQGKVFTWPNWR